MHRIVYLSLGTLALSACTAPAPSKSPQDQPAEGASSNEDESPDPEAKSAAPASSENEFQLADSKTARDAHGETASQIKPTETEAALKFIVVDKDKGALEGIVISLSAPGGQKYYTKETDGTGYAEVLVPVGTKYDLTYLSLGRRDISATVPVNDDPHQNIKLTLRYKNKIPPPPTAKDQKRAGFILKGVTFDTGRATIRPESYPELDNVVEYLTHKTSARIEVAGHTDNVGDPGANKRLSEARAKSCRQYMKDKGIDGSRIETVGYGDSQPLAPNDSDDGRKKNRRIEAIELY
jgi:outer membrane protein OmpA-like peptidoglycan-associated protein